MFDSYLPVMDADNLGFHNIIHNNFMLLTLV